jgi:DNA polymerase-3 subunit beta
MRLIEGEFPSYDQVIPISVPRQITVPVENLTQALRRVALLSSTRSHTIKFQVSEGHIDISSSNPDLGDAHEQLDIDYVGEPAAMAFNARYLLDALAATHAKEILFGFENELTPSRIIPTDDDDTLAVVMPMRL